MVLYFIKIGACIEWNTLSIPLDILEGIIFLVWAWCILHKLGYTSWYESNRNASLALRLPFNKQTYDTLTLTTYVFINRASHQNFELNSPTEKLFFLIQEKTQTTIKLPQKNKTEGVLCSTS